MLINVIIFDMDGVLTDSMKYHIESWNYAFNQFNIFPSDEDIALLEGMSYKETINFISKKYKTKLNQNEKEKIYLTKKDKLSKIFNFEVYPQIPKFLSFLKKQNFRLALVSGANKEFVNKIINKYFKNYFEIIITGSDVKKGKPNPEPYLKAIKELNCPINKIIVIENAPLGIKSAKKAKLRTFAITTTLDKKYLKKADKIFSSHEELINYFKELIWQNKNPKLKTCQKLKDQEKN